MQTLILRAEFASLEEAVTRSYNPQDIFFSDEQLQKLFTYTAISAYLRRHPSDGVLAHMRQDFVKEKGAKQAEELLPQKEVDIERSLQLHVIRGYYTWSMVMLSLKDGHIYEYDASSQNTTPESRFRRVDTYENWLRKTLGQTKQRVSLGGSAAEEHEQRDAQIAKMSTMDIHAAFY